MRKFEHYGLEDFAANSAHGQRTVSNTNNRRKNLRVTIQPSMLRAKEFKVKNECS